MCWPHYLLLCLAILEIIHVFEQGGKNRRIRCGRGKHASAGADDIKVAADDAGCLIRQPPVRPDGNPFVVLVQIVLLDARGAGFVVDLNVGVPYKLEL